MGRARARSGPGDAGLAGATKGKVTYIEADGTGHTVELPVGENVMRGALAHDLPGIVGECGGGLACATCHCGTGSIHHIGYKSLTAEAEAAIRAMLAANPQGKHGKHEYRLEDYGLSRRQVHEAACTSLSTYVDNGYGTAQQHLAADSIGFDGLPRKAAKLALWV